VIDLALTDQFSTGTVYLGLAAYGGNYDQVPPPPASRLLLAYPSSPVPCACCEQAAAPAAVAIRIQGPSLVLAGPALALQPQTSVAFLVRLDTAPSAAVRISAASSDPAVVAVSGPASPAADTADQTFVFSHVAPGRASVSFSVSAPAGSTYGNVSLPAASAQVAVETLVRILTWPISQPNAVSPAEWVVSWPVPAVSLDAVSPTLSG
jgi:hypothetical protein